MHQVVQIGGVSGLGYLQRVEIQRMMRRLINDCAPARTSNGIVKVVREAVVRHV